MSLFNLFGSNQTGREEKIKKKMLLEFCTLDELVKVWKMYVSKSNPKFKYTDENGLTKFRETTRKELTEALIDQVHLDGIIKVLPHLQDRLDRLQENA